MIHKFDTNKNITPLFKNTLPTMKKSILSLILLFTLVYTVNAQDDYIPHTLEQQKAAKKLAADWMSMFYQVKDADSIMKISKIPFLLDGKEIINSNEKLIDVYNAAIEDKGSLESPEIKAEIFDRTKYKAKVEFSMINSLLVYLAITEKNERTQHLLVFIEVDENDLKIIGFQD